MFSKPLSEVNGTPEFLKWLNGLLNETYPITVSFTKKDGTTRVMQCTKNLSNIPLEKHPKNTETKESSSVRVFDLEKQDWRSFLPSSVTEISFTIGVTQ